MTFHYKSRLIFFVMILFTITISFSVQAATDSEPPVVLEQSVSPAVIAFKGNSTPGYTVIHVKTNEPTRGHISVIGNGISTTMNISNDFKTEHTVERAPWDYSNGQPLPPGEYQLKLNLVDENYNESNGYPLGTIRVVEESDPKPLIESITSNPKVISPKYKQTQNLTDISYKLNRPAKVKMTIQKDGRNYFNMDKVELSPGIQNISWNGRDKEGRIAPDGVYQIVIEARELTFNQPYWYWEMFDQGEITIQDGENNMPVWRMKEIVTNASFAQPSFSPNGDGVNDTVTGTITISEDVKVSLWMVNAVNIHIKNLGSFEGKGTHSFTWNGTEFMGGTVINGSYSLKVTVNEGTEQGYFISEENVRVAGDKEMNVPDDGQKVRVIKDNPEMEGFYGQPYTGGKKGDIYQILGFENYHYSVLLTEGATGTINAADVELLNIDSIPLQWGKIVKETPTYEGPTSFSQEIETLLADSLFRILRKDGTYYRLQLDLVRQGYVHQDNITIVEKEELDSTTQTFHIVKSGDMLWKIADQYNVTVDELISINLIDPNKYLFIGQKIIIPAANTHENQQRNITYIVQAGDMLWKIAQKNNVSLDQLIQTNNLDPSQYLLIGQKLIIHQPIQEAVPTNIYTVQSGDTLWKIAGKHHTTIQSLTQLNGLKQVDYIYTGQQLKLF